MPKDFFDEEIINSVEQKKSTRMLQFDTLFKKPLIKDNHFDLAQLGGSYNDYPEFKRLVGHLKRWNLAATKQQHTDQKEMDLFNHLYRMLRCIKYQQTSVQQNNLAKLEDWFLSHYRKTQTIESQIKFQNLDFENRNKPFRNKEASQLLKHYSKPYQICLKIFEKQKNLKKTREQKQNQSIQRCAKYRIKKQSSKMLQQKEEQEMYKTMQQFRQTQAKRKMVYDKAKLRYKRGFDYDDKPEFDPQTISFSKYSKSSHTQLKQGLPNMVDFILRRANKSRKSKKNQNQNFNESRDSLKQVSMSNNVQSRSRMDTPLNFSPKPNVSTTLGYRLMVNPFFQNQGRKKKI